MEELKIAFEALTLYQNQYAQVDKLWGYFGVVSLAVSGFIVGSERATRGFKEPLAIVGVYITFCFGNHKALVDGQKQLEQFADIAKSLALKAELDVSAISPIPHQDVADFHLAVIIALSIGLLAVSFIRKRHSEKSD